ncbi:MAG: prepilin-type N-terminal cleavage/methylation domain-containing protein [Desulfobacterales bacterium]|nr:prepilin-type N-terminal cleavage/methylation domain-containing protein [Desulfobacterales bacterium]
MRKGFTLLELLIVVVILGVLALIATPALLNTADQAREGAVKANVSAAVSSATSRMAIEGGADPTDIASGLIDTDFANEKNPFDKNRTCICHNSRTRRCNN